MQNPDLNLDDGLAANENREKSREARLLSVQRCVNILAHSCQCKDADCPLTSCAKMKRVAQHTKVCKRKTNGGCPICKQLIALCCYHAKACTNRQNCTVPFCVNIKIKIRQQRRKHRLRQARAMRRRMAARNEALGG